MNARSKLREAKNKEYEDLFAFHLQINGLSKYFARELMYIPGRKFRLDFGDPIHKIGIEIQGGIWSTKYDGHNSGGGITRDTVKINLGHMHGWRIFQFPTDQIKSLAPIDLIRRYYTHILKIELPAAGKSN